MAQENLSPRKFQPKKIIVFSLKYIQLEIFPTQSFLDDDHGEGGDDGDGVGVDGPAVAHCAPV